VKSLGERLEGFGQSIEGGAGYVKQSKAWYMLMSMTMALQL
jgi:hypothetical protein